MDGNDADIGDLRGVAAGDADALGRLYDRHAARLLGYARSIVGPDGAEEVLQDVFVAVWQKAHTFEQRSLVSTWLYMVTRRRALNHLRHRRPTPIDPHELVGVGRDVGAVSTGIEDEAIARLSLDQLLVALDHLSAHHREVLVLCFIDDLPYGDVAEILSIPVGTVKSRVSTARAKLLTRLNGQSVRQRTGNDVDVSHRERHAR